MSWTGQGFVRMMEQGVEVTELNLADNALGGAGVVRVWWPRLFPGSALCPPSAGRD